MRRRYWLALAGSALALLGWAAPAGAGPGMGWGQWTSPNLTFGECATRAPRALKAEGFTTIERHGRVWFGLSAGPVSAVIICYGLAKGAIVTISAANDGDAGPSGATVGRLADSIFVDEKPIPAPGSQPLQQPGPSTIGDGWTSKPAVYRGQNGKRVSYSCPANGTPTRIWGTDVYTDDSTPCSAAVHAGVITIAKGGTVTIEIRPGESSYTGSTRNGITSEDYGPWSGSFVFVVLGKVKEPPPKPTGGSGWSSTAAAYRGQNGKRYTWGCPAGGAPAQLWGTDVYTDDSSVCTAAVHAGLITLVTGGTVTIEIRPGESSYTGSTRNGINSGGYGAWVGSFVLVT